MLCFSIFVHVLKCEDDYGSGLGLALIVRGTELAGEGRVEFRAEGSLSPHGTHLAPDVV